MHFLRDYLAKANAESLFREIRCFSPVDAVHLKKDGVSYLNLASNNYLGLTHCPKVQLCAAHAALSSGTGSGGARLITGSHQYYQKLEQELADFKGAEASLVFSTGYMANVGTISALADSEDIIFSDELNHASIIDGCRLSRAKIIVYRHSDTTQLAQLLAATPCRGKRLIVTDGVFSMDGDIAPLPEIVRLADIYNAVTIVDDAHATGVIGPGGRGTAAYFGLEGKVTVQVGTLSKALAAEGGFAAGSRILIDYLINRARSFIFNTALSPAVTAAAWASLTELKARPELVTKLAANAEFARGLLRSAGFNIGESSTPVIPLLIGAAAAAVELADRLYSQKIIISAIRPPTVRQGSSRLRLAISAAHEKDELADAIGKLIKAAHEMAIIPRGD